jgi:hypothetical protein
VHFVDLTPYCYGVQPQLGVLNVGWLSATHPFARALPDERFVDALRKLVSKPVNLYRGIHPCEFCPAPPIKLARNGLPIFDPVPGTTGYGEIRVTGANGITYAAPVLILHYVAQHHYQPPAEFIAAAMRAVSS